MWREATGALLAPPFIPRAVGILLSSPQPAFPSSLITTCLHLSTILLSGRWNMVRQLLATLFARKATTTPRQPPLWPRRNRPCLRVEQLEDRTVLNTDIAIVTGAVGTTVGGTFVGGVFNPTADNAS